MQLGELSGRFADSKPGTRALKRSLFEGLLGEKRRGLAREQLGLIRDAGEQVGPRRILRQGGRGQARRQQKEHLFILMQLNAAGACAAAKRGVILARCPP